MFSFSRSRHDEYQYTVGSQNSMSTFFLKPIETPSETRWRLWLTCWLVFCWPSFWLMSKYIVAHRGLDITVGLQVVERLQPAVPLFHERWNCKLCLMACHKAILFVDTQKAYRRMNWRAPLNPLLRYIRLTAKKTTSRATHAAKLCCELKRSTHVYMRPVAETDSKAV